MQIVETNKLRYQGGRVINCHYRSNKNDRRNNK